MYPLPRCAVGPDAHGTGLEAIMMIGLVCLGWQRTLLWAHGRSAAAPAGRRSGRSGPGLRAVLLSVAAAVGLGVAVLGIGLGLRAGQAQSQARWLAEALAPDLALGDARRAAAALQALHHLPDVQAARLLLPQGQALAHFDRRRAGCAAPAGPGGLRIALDQIVVRQPVQYLGLPVGTLSLCVGLDGVYQPAAMILVIGLVAGSLAGLAWRRGAGRSSGQRA